MLTEIEWWGGLLYLCGALAYWITYKEIGMKWALDYIGFHLAFLTSAVLLALYFYELDSPLLQKLYVGLTVMALVSILLMWFWPSSDEEPSADSLHEDAADEEADEEPGLLTIIIGNLVLCGPLLATVVLGALKSYGLAQQLGWMS